MPDATRSPRHGAGVLRAAGAIALVGGTAALCYFTIDVPAAVWAKASDPNLPPLLKNLLAGTRVFGQGVSVAFAVCLILVLDPKRRRDVGLFIMTMVFATLVVHLAKGIGGRLRPWAYLNEMEALRAADALRPESMWHFFRGFSRARYGSFPSAHAAAAFAMAAVFLRMYPRAARLFLTTAALCAISRITDSQHYPSDVIVGGAIGLWIGLGMFQWRWSTRAADWIERRNVRNISWMRMRLERHRHRRDTADK